MAFELAAGRDATAEEARALLVDFEATVARVDR